MISTIRRGTLALALIVGWASVGGGQPGGAVLTIEQVVARFLERNVAVEAARHRIEVARAEQIGARLHPNPTLTLTAENLPFAGPTPASQLYEVGGTISQPIERTDKRRHRREVADAAVAVAEAEFAEALGQRLRDVKRAFYETVAARQSVAHATDTRRAFQQLVDITDARFREGAVAEAEVVKVRLERARLDAAVSQAHVAVRQAGVKLLELLGETEFSTAGAVSDRAAGPDPVVPDVGLLKREALGQRPGVRAAEHALTLAERRVALERARNTGDVAPFIGVKRVASDSTVLFGIAIPLPLTDRNEGGIARAVAEERVARAELVLRRNAILAEVESAYRGWLSARERTAAFERELLSPAEESRVIAARAYEEGAIDLLGYLEALRTHADVRRQYLQSAVDAQVALSQLEHAVGRELKR